MLHWLLAASDIGALPVFYDFVIIVVRATDVF